MINLTLARIGVASTLALGGLALAACGDNAAPSQPTTPPAAEAPATPATPDAGTAAPAAAAPITGEWAALQTFISKTPEESKLLVTSPIAADLRALLGDKHSVFLANMQVQSPLQQDGDVLFTSGNKQHAGGSDQAYLLIHPQTKALEVGLWEAGKLTTYKTDGSNTRKPQDVQTMISNAQS